MLLIFRLRECIITWFGFTNRKSTLRVLFWIARLIFRTLSFAKSPQAAGTDFDFADLALVNDRRLLNIHFKLTFGVPH
jgi:hypothetical protein